ncbi:hypothetical protein BDB00DRAFT_794287 [Zychaea mexicana]|uniref:uncharacterized protein n=1 Tax=Zychaea mexicana TaxID=64656 RepID=UPI0022FE0280|nr:uncharacterized protein BDB00DRAFT_794287 [Zychaea mexicana]KAI9499506.1 hypothetical protein BDB00DRAFT_794287 [Zychaea mexicana]
MFLLQVSRISVCLCICVSYTSTCDTHSSTQQRAAMMLVYYGNLTSLQCSNAKDHDAVLVYTYLICVLDKCSTDTYTKF